MRGDDARRADPHPRLDIADERVAVFGFETRQIRARGHRLHRQRRWRVVPAIFKDVIERRGELGRALLEIESREIVIVEEAPLDRRRPEHGGDRIAAIEPAHVIGERLRRLASGLHDRPIRHQLPEHDGTGGWQDFVVEDFSADVRSFGDELHRALGAPLDKVYSLARVASRCRLNRENC